MINIYIYKDKEVAYGFKVTGHSDYAEHGKDIVCSAVSALTQTMLMTLKNMYGHECKYIMRNGYMEVNLRDVEGLKESQILFKSLELGIAAIQEQYPKYVELN